MSHRKTMKKISWALGILGLLSASLFGSYVWLASFEFDAGEQREPSSVDAGLPTSLKTFQLELDRAGDELAVDAVVAAARIAIPPIVATLDMDGSIKKRLMARLYSSNFQDRIVPFLMNSVGLYRPSGAPKTFHDFISPKLSDFRGTPGLEHELFKIDPSLVEEKLVDGQKATGLGAKKALVVTVLRLYDALYLQTGAHIGNGVPKLDSEQLRVVKQNFETILRSLMVTQKDNKEIEDGIQVILKDDLKKEIVTLSISRFVYEFLERHYRVYVEPRKRQRALRKWAERGLDTFLNSRDPELYRFIKWEVTKKRYVVHVVVDGLQGGLMESLTGNNPTFLKRVAQEHRESESHVPKSEITTALKIQQTDFLNWAAEDPRRLENPRYLPFFKKIYADHRDFIARSGISTTPTISVRNLPIAMTGINVTGPRRGTGLPNFHYVDRLGVDREDRVARAYYFFGNDAILLSDITARAGLKTMFERTSALGLDSVSCSTAYDRGATVAFDPFLNLALGEKVRDFGEVNCLAELGERAAHEKDLQSARSHLVSQMNAYAKSTGIWPFEQIKKFFLRRKLRDTLEEYVLLSQKGLPAYLQMYDPWPDHFAHFQGPFSDAILSPTGELSRLDHWLGSIESLYRKSGLLGRTRFGMAGDHGLTPVYRTLNPEVEVFEKFIQETGIELKVKKISSDEGEGPKISHPLKPEPVKGYDLIIASTAGGNYMVDAFVDQDANWKRQPNYRELRKLRTLGGATIDLIDMITRRLPETLDYLAVRDSVCTSESCELSIVAQRAGKQVRERIYRKGDRVYYRPTADLLSVRSFSPYRDFDESERRAHDELLARCVDRAELRSVQSWCTESEWRSLASRTPRPDSVNQIAHLYDSDKAGTLNLFPRQGMGYNTHVPGRHAGEHFHEKDAFVGVWGPGLKRDSQLESAVNGSLAPTLLEWLSPKAAAEKDEFGFPIIR